MQRLRMLKGRIRKLETELRISSLSKAERLQILDSLIRHKHSLAEKQARSGEPRPPFVSLGDVLLDVVHSLADGKAVPTC